VLLWLCAACILVVGTVCVIAELISWAGKDRTQPPTAEGQ
jgi:hypothetical protein